MTQSRSALRQTPPRRGGAVALLATALIAVAPTAGRAQSNNQAQEPLLPVVAKGAKLMTYYGGLIPKDGYLIVPAKGDSRNFLECNRKLISVDEKQLKDSTHKDCGMKRYDPGPIQAYIKAFETNGDVQIFTQFGTETISKEKWDNLVAKSEPNTPSKEIKEGNSAVFIKNDQGRFDHIYVLAPKIGYGG